MELAYIGGLLGLDMVVDHEAQEKAFMELATRRRPSPLRKG